MDFAGQLGSHEWPLLEAPYRSHRWGA